MLNLYPERFDVERNLGLGPASDTLARLLNILEPKRVSLRSP